MQKVGVNDAVEVARLFLSVPLNFSQSGPYQNKKFCHYKTLPQYQNPKSQPSPYRYFPGTVFSSNHFSQSPNTYNTSTGTAAYR